MDNKGFNGFNYKKKKDETEEESFARKWRLFVIIAVSAWAIYEFVIKPTMGGA